MLLLPGLRQKLPPLVGLFARSDRGQGVFDSIKIKSIEIENLGVNVDMSLADCSGADEVIKKYQLHDKDTGSPEVQIALLTKRLEDLKSHFNSHPQDKHSKRGLLRIVTQRKKLLSYLQNEDVTRYRETLKRFNLRK